MDARFETNPAHDPARVAAPDATAGEFFGAMPGYQATSLREAGPLASRWGVSRVWLKDETERATLPSFKIVGALWALHRLFCEQVGLEAGDTTAEELRRRLDGRGLRVLTASAGNWGRAVAHAARLMSVPATVLVPAVTAPGRIGPIEDEGARVEIVHGNFDETVAEAAARADEQNLLVADASESGEDPFPGWVSDGYESLFAEIDNDLARSNATWPDVVVVPIGAGALAAAAARHYARSSNTHLVGVEPHDAASAMASARAGRIVTVPAASPTPMAGLNCGTPSAVAWPDIAAGFAGFCSISDSTAEEGMRTLAGLGIHGGACSGATVGASDELLANGSDARQSLGLKPQHSILVLLTEGITDPEHYRTVVGDQ